MKRRVKLYLFGFLLGCALTAGIFGDKIQYLFSWLPNQRILDRIQQTELKQTPKANCMIECYQISNKNIQDLIYDGTVQIPKSEPQAYPKIYFIEHETEEFGRYALRFECYEKSSIIIEAKKFDVEIECNCDQH